jgi:hypothetical protein
LGALCLRICDGCLDELVSSRRTELVGRRQLVTSNEAAVVVKQHTRPCSDCPFARTALSGWLGRSTPGEWVTLAHSDSSVECHALKDSDGFELECAGAAIYRANVAKSLRDPKAFKLPPNTTLVFATSQEFVMHHIKAPFKKRRR